MINRVGSRTINPLTDTIFQALEYRWKLEQGVSRESGSVKSNCLPDRSASGGTPWWFFWAQPRTPIKSKSPTGHCGRYSEQLPLRPTTSAWRMSCGSSSCRELVGLKTTTPTIRTYHLDDNKELFLSLSLYPLPLPLFFPPLPPLNIAIRLGNELQRVVKRRLSLNWPTIALRLDIDLTPSNDRIVVKNNVEKILERRMSLLARDERKKKENK